jgi:hypothetical protein
MITETLTKSQFSDAFNKMGRGEQFSYAARNLIYDYLDESESYELDVIGICCEFAEYENLEEFQTDYGKEYNSMEIIEEATTVLRNNLEGGAFVIVQF